MTKMNRLIISLLFFTSITFSQDTLWTKTFGGDGGGTDIGYSVKQTTDGGYIITGITDFYPTTGIDGDVLLLKVDSIGTEEWTQKFGGNSEYIYDEGKSVQQTSDGGYIITGITENSNNGTSVLLIKTDYMGTEEWRQTYIDFSINEGHYVEQMSDGGFIIMGYSALGPTGYGTYDFLLLKTDSLGNEEWTQLHGDVNTIDVGYHGQQTTDGGFIIVGESDGSDVMLIKTDTQGDEEWSQTFGDGTSEGYCVQQTIDGGYIITGITNFNSNGYYDIYLIKTNSSGAEQWSRNFGGSGWEYGYSVKQTSDGGFIIAGHTTSYGLGGDAWIIKTNSNGNEEWNQTYHRGGSDFAYSVEQTTDGGFVFVGKTGSSNIDVLMVKIAPEIEVGINEVLFTKYSIHQNYPNPFNPETTLRYDLPENSLVNITIYDIMGREVKTLINHTQDAGYRSVIWDATNDYGKPVSAGIYLYQIQAGEFVQTKKMVLLK
jgi:hypothetical protein